MDDEMGLCDSIRAAKVDKRNMIGRIMSFCFLAIILVEYYMGINIRYSFNILILISYILLLPKRLLNPKNVVFFYYFVWYVLGPFGSNYKRFFVEYADYLNLAYLMLSCTYFIIMLVLDIIIGDTESSIEYNYENHNNQNRVYVPLPIKTAIIILMLLSLSIFVYRTGGLGNWIGKNLSDGHFSRRGSGLYSLIFQYTYYFLLFVEGQHRIINKTDMIRRIVYVVTLPIMFVFIASKGQMVLCILLLFASYIVDEKLISWKSILLSVVGIAIYIINMYVRIRDWTVSLGHTLNYFDTLEKFLMVLKNYNPSFLLTFYMPFTWPFVKTGLLPDSVYYDYNIWLTDLYNHYKWDVLQATDQWNIETDMYLNFGYVFAIPLVVALFGFVAWLYKKMIHQGGIWIYIYILEFMICISHLRGGIILYWDWFLIPMYLWLIVRYANESK